MSRKLISVLFAMAAMVGSSLVAQAGSNGSPQEAQAMVERAAGLLETQGRDSAFQAFNNPSGEFVDRDLYVFVLDMSGTTVAHGVNPALIGKSLLKAKDADGKLFIQEILDLANSSGAGWVDYKWPNPTTKKVDAKSSFIKKVGDLIVGVGVYKG